MGAGQKGVSYGERVSRGCKKTGKLTGKNVAGRGGGPEVQISWLINELERMMNKKKQKQKTRI